jgi:SAM-dependent methyltransferase
VALTGFSPDWLALREAADARARAPALAAMLGRFLARRRSVTVVDLGCGTGANLRAIAGLLGRRQSWRLVDHDQALLDEAASRLSGWADAVENAGTPLTLRKGDRLIDVRFRRADLRDECARGEFRGADLVTASALFDLVSAEVIASLAREVARAGTLFYAVLTYDGTQSWAPPHAADERVLDAFNAHQSRDKGLGPAAGGAAHDHLVAAFAASGARVHVAASPWLLGSADVKLIDRLASDVAAAAHETGLIADEEIIAWLASKRQGCEIGHQDLLVVPD